MAIVSFQPLRLLHGVMYNTYIWINQLWSRGNTFYWTWPKLVNIFFCAPLFALPQGDLLTHAAFATFSMRQCGPESFTPSIFTLSNLAIERVYAKEVVSHAQSLG
jgi:hypothetical protein